MTPLVGLPFHLTFDFARTVSADYRNRFDAVVTAAVDEPRFDHHAGVRRGLLVEPGPDYGQHDAVTVLGGDWADVRRATVMFEWEEVDAGIRRRALYSTDVRKTVDAMLRIAGWHRRLMAVPDYLPNLGDATTASFVKYRGIHWPLGNALDAGNGKVLGDADGRILIESA